MLELASHNMQLINSALLAALLASVAEGAVELFYTTTLSFDQSFAIAVADSQLVLINKSLKQDSLVRPRLEEYISLFQATVKGGNFTWDAYSANLKALRGALSNDPESTIEEVIYDGQKYTPWEWLGELKEYQWDALNHGLERAYNTYVEQGKSTDALDPIIEQRQQLVKKDGAAQALAGDGHRDFYKALDTADSQFAAELIAIATKDVNDLVRNNKHPSESTIESSSGSDSKSSETPATTTVRPVGTPAPAPSTASLASVSVAVATVALSLVAMFA